MVLKQGEQALLFLGDDNDVLANYGGIFQHKGTRKLEVASS